MTNSVSSSDGESATPSQGRTNRDLIEGILRHQEQRKTLTQNPNFRLLKVVHRKARIVNYWKKTEYLTVVTPATNPTIAEDVKQKGWYCLSHLWGDPSEWIVWGNAGVVDGDTGKPIKPKVHPDKREEILSLVQGSDQYWWIDIFCAQSDTPLGIMGDIYKYCNACVTLVDRPYEEFDSADSDLLKDTVKLSSIHLKQTAAEYLAIINKTHHKDDVSAEWMHVLKDVLHWPSTQLEETANLDLIRWKAIDSKTPRAEQFFDSLMQYPVDERIATAQKFFNSKEYNTSDFFHIEKQFMTFLQEQHLARLRRAQQNVAAFLNCRWMNRVWTLQELALSGRIDLSDVVISRTSFDLWEMDFTTLLKVTVYAYKIQERTSMVRKSNRERGRVVQSPRQVLDYYQRTNPVLARIYSDYRKILEVAIAIGYKSRFRSEDNNDNIRRRIMLNSFATSQRKTLYPEDYVYGVLGILDIDIPRSKDLKQIWHIFSTKLQDQYPDIHVPSDVNLAKATKMEDVYGEFGFPWENDVSCTVVGYFDMEHIW